MDDISSTQACFDLLSGLHGIKLEMDIPRGYRDIPDNQDDTYEEGLDRWVLLNIEYDYRTK